MMFLLIFLLATVHSTVVTIFLGHTSQLWIVDVSAFCLCAMASFFLKLQSVLCSQQESKSIVV